MVPEPQRETTAVPAVYSRAQWLAYADRLLAAVRPYASANGARINFPGAEGGYGAAVDGLEGFARTFLLAGFRIAGARGVGVDRLIDDYTRGIRAGVDPAASDRWVRMEEHPQAKVEAASLALILDMTRPWIWDRLDETTQQRVIDYLAPAVGDTSYPPNNWLWFRVVVQTFLRSVGGLWSASDIAADLRFHDSLRRADGWMSDGLDRGYDHYVGWALHLYPVLWSRMSGAADLAADRIERARADVDRYLQDAVALVGGDGSPLLQGRSLIYRFAAAAPMWAGVFAEVPSTSPGLLRTAASQIVSHFANVTDRDGAPTDILTLGWQHAWPPLAQSYSGPGSPYWAVKGMLGIALPEDHPVWAAPAEPLPVTRGDTLRAVRAPGWIISGTAADGIVRVINHGTDHGREGAPGTEAHGESPLYARIGYSTATAPLLDDDAWQNPLDQAVVLLDADGNASHRNGMTLLGTGISGSGAETVGFSSAAWQAFWLRPGSVAHRHGSGLPGTARLAGWLTVHSLVRGAHEVRIVKVGELESEVVAVRIGGWPVTGDLVRSAATAGAASAQIATPKPHPAIRTSAIHTVLGEASAHLAVREDASPLGPNTYIPYLEGAAVAGSRLIALVTLHGESSPTSPLATVTETGESVTVVWPDGTETTTDLSELRTATPAGR